MSDHFACTGDCQLEPGYHWRVDLPKYSRPDLIIIDEDLGAVDGHEPDNPEADFDPDEVDAAADRYEHMFDKQWGD